MTLCQPCSNRSLLLQLSSAIALLACGFVAPALSAQSQSSSASLPANGPYCEAAGQIKIALEKFANTKQGPDETDYAFWLAQRNAIEKLRQQYPNDYFVQRAYVDNRMGGDPSTSPFPSEKGSLEMIAEYKALHEQHPDDPVIEDLYAITLIDRDTPSAIKLLDDVLQKKPALPWPHQDFLNIYTSPNFDDKTKLKSHLSALLIACPATLNNYSWVASNGDEELTRNTLVRLRKVIGTRTDPDAVGAYPTLWSLEFKSHPPSDYDALRKEVAADVARIRALKRDDDFLWWYTLAQGYPLLGDEDQTKWAEAGRNLHIFLEDPALHTAPAIAHWFHDHPRPSDDDTKDHKRAFHRAELKQTGEWIAEYPKVKDVWRDRMEAMRGLDDVPPADCAATAERRLQLEEANNEPFPLYWYTYLDVADFLSTKHVNPAREVELGSKALDVIAAEWENVEKKDLRSTSDDFDFYPKFFWPMNKARALLYESEGYARLKQPDQALAALAKVNLQLQALASDMAADPTRPGLQGRNGLYHRFESQYWQGLARVAEFQGRNMDAIAYYQSALVGRFDSDHMPVPGEKDELADEAHQLWATLGGTDDGWDDLYKRRANVLAENPQLEWDKSQEPLPYFKLADLNGKMWTPADLQGKVTFINFWATWCGICREEFPSLEKLAEQYKDQPDVVFLSLNVDDDLGLIAPFVQDHKLTFTVLPAYDYVTGTLKVIGIPQNWIVAPDGVVRLKGNGYDATDKWEAGMKDAIDQFRTLHSAPCPSPKCHS